MLVFEVMTRDPITVQPGTPVKRALAMLAERGITSMPVVSGSGVVCGVVSEADLIRELLAKDPRAHEVPIHEAPARPVTVDQVMSAHPVTVHGDDDLVEAVDLLTSTMVKSVPVVDRKGRLQGMLSRSDIVRLLARADEDIERQVDELLRSTGIEGWLVGVQDGTVHLLGPERTSDALVARLLAETVPGVLSVETSQEPRP